MELQHTIARNWH